jgi:hypothetical protein
MAAIKLLDNVYHDGVYYARGTVLDTDAQTLQPEQLERLISGKAAEMLASAIGDKHSGYEDIGNYETSPSNDPKPDGKPTVNKRPKKSEPLTGIDSIK